MKAKDRRRLQKLAEQERKESGLPLLDIKRLIASSPVMQEMILAVSKQDLRDGTKYRKGSDNN